MTILTPTDIAALRRDQTDPQRDRVHRIAGECARVAGVTLARVLGPDRSREITRIRDVIAHRSAFEGIPNCKIAQVLRRDPSSISQAIRREAARRGEV